MRLHPSIHPRFFAAAVAAACLLAGSALSAQEATFRVRHALDDADGSFSAAALIQARDGNFYGTASLGGASMYDGTVFRLTPAGVFTVLYSFDGSEGSEADGALIEAEGGNFYGTTYFEGPDGFGTLYRISPAGAVSILHSFDGNGTDPVDPSGALILASDGNFYGTTLFGGANDDGTIFQVTPSGVLSILHDFTSADSVSISAPAGVIEGTDGNFYGTTYGGGTSGEGTIYRLTKAGVFTVLHSFNQADGPPTAGLVQATDGGFYGTTAKTVFRVTAAGAYTVLHRFTSTEGSNPAGALIQARDGNFYGTATDGGADNDGTVFEITPDGALTVLHSFDKTDGSNPAAALVQASDGTFYGITQAGGPSDDGTIFQLSVAGELQFDAATYGAAEGAERVVLQVSRTDGSQGAVTVHYTTADGTARAGRDYQPATGTLSWAAGDASARTITVTLLNPGLEYGGSTRAFTVGLDAPTGGAIVGPINAARVVLTGATNPPVITSALTASADVGTPFRYQITAANGPGGYGVSGLPEGLTVNVGTGLISGTVMKVRTYPLTLNVYSGGGQASATLTLTVQPAGTPLISSPPTASAAVGAAFSYQIVASGNPTTYGGQDLPGGLTINPGTGLLSGAPTMAGTYTPTLTAVNGVGNGSAQLILMVQPQGTPLVTGPATAAGTVGAAFSYRIVADGSPTAYGVEGLVGGLTVDARTGLISGTPKFAAVSTLTLHAYNAAGKGSATLTLTIAAP